MKKPHKFFDIYINNNLDLLYNDLFVLNHEIASKNICRIPDKIFNQNMEKPGLVTQYGVEYYNIFTFVNESIHNLYIGLQELTKQACSYYDIDFKSEKYFIHGWFNLDYKTTSRPNSIGGVNPIVNPQHFHDHSGGQGAPWFHGYYCVNAEPSSTFYKINNSDDQIFENINKNNRAILSETGHPHGRDDWFEDNPRITIAYDITPIKNLNNSAIIGKWIPLI